MKLMEYWPSLHNINDCIRNEAEELAEHTLLAVHEPMKFLRHDANGNAVGYETQEDLLRHFLATPRPLPIIGKVGAGKSHIIRWLDANLRLMPESKDWHIVRIPKSASLREVLTLLLAGLDGKAFEDARAQIHQVSEKLTDKELAEWLLVIMGQQLRRLHEKNGQEMEALRQQKNLTAEQKLELKPRMDALRVIDIHAAENALPTLINDVFFKRFLLNEQHCLFRLTKRLTSGASSEELGENDHQLKASDLDFEFNAADLSAPAFAYFSTSKLITHEEVRQSAADILNMVLGDATRTLFNQLYSFQGRSFSELFNLIRQALHQQGKTLMVLVEDMSLISAIEDVLIDSLEREGIRDGEEVLCPVCSAIAVTDGYSGYQRRRQGIRDRARGEWVIEDISDAGNTVTQQRIINFCSRYLNAARFGSDKLRQLWLDRQPGADWPPIWRHDDSDEELQAFGTSNLGISLYPFNANAICALANKYCRDAGLLRFNPRNIIRDILLNILLLTRRDAENDCFPPLRLAEISPTAAVRNWLYRQNVPHQERAESLLAIWGYPAENEVKLRETLSSDILSSFGFDQLAGAFKHVVLGKELETVLGTETETETETETKIKTEAKPQSPSVVFFEEAAKAIDAWINNDQRLDQKFARLIRSSLANVYEHYGQAEWSGIKSLPSIRAAIKGQVNIYIYNADSNRGEKTVWFCSVDKFKNSRYSVILYNVAIALIRAEYFRSQRKEDDWSYPEAANDFLYIQNFAAEWVPNAVRDLIEEQRTKLSELLTAQLQLARALGVVRNGDGNKDILSRLLLKERDIKKQMVAPVTDAVKAICQKSLREWSAARSAWLDLVASNDHALEGDILPQILQEAFRSPADKELTRAIADSLKELRSSIQMLECLSDCENASEFNGLIAGFGELFMEMSNAGDYHVPEALPQAHELIASMNSLTQGNIWSTLQNLRQVQQSDDAIRQWRLLCNLDRDVLKRAMDTLNKWTQVSIRLINVMSQYNAEMGGGKIIEYRAEIDAMFNELDNDMTKICILAGDENAHA
ncbi:TPA: hypothetical protein JG889_004152 [Enterobacter hormaechei subsp. steigerwaltii]|nr:hypothetical protein [Enterobacter hormaechei subsp. steigerwaltii]HBT3148861.1 hypothetical protein [Klebsiella aerogenes]